MEKTDPHHRCRPGSKQATTKPNKWIGNVWLDPNSIDEIKMIWGLGTLQRFHFYVHASLLRLFLCQGCYPQRICVLSDFVGSHQFDPKRLHGYVRMKRIRPWYLPRGKIYCSNHRNEHAMKGNLTDNDIFFWFAVVPIHRLQWCYVVWMHNQIQSRLKKKKKSVGNIILERYEDMSWIVCTFCYWFSIILGRRVLFLT